MSFETNLSFSNSLINKIFLVLLKGKVNLDILAQSFISAGYQHKGDYDFEEKKLKAKHFEHANPALPLILISELLLEEFSDQFNSIVSKKMIHDPT